LSNRVSFALAVLLLLIAAAFRMAQFPTLPPGLHAGEITDIGITERVRDGEVRVFHKLGIEGREGLYHTVLAAVTSVIGRGLIGYHMLSVWIGMLTLAVVYALALRLFNPLAAFASMALLAVGMWPTLLAREVSRESWLPLLVAGVLLTLAIAFSVYHRHHARIPSTAAFAMLGVGLGLGFYVHPAGFAAALFSMAFIAYMLLSRQPMTRQTLGYIAFAILVMVIVAMPYLISSIRLPELSGAGRLLGNYTFAQKPPLQAIADGLAGIVFVGDSNPAHNLPGRPLVDIVSGVFMLVGLLTAVRYRRKPRYTLLLIATAVLAPLAFLTADSPNFLAFSPLLPLLALYFGLGVSTILAGMRGPMRNVVGVGLIGLLLFNIVWTAQDLFVTWPKLEAVQRAYHARIGKLSHHLDMTADTIPTVLCVPELMPSPVLNAPSDLQILTMMMHRPDTPLRYADCGTGLVLANGGEFQQVVLLDDTTFDNAHPYLKQWLQMGEMSTDPSLPPESVVYLDVATELGDTVGRFSTTAPAGFAPEAPGGENLAPTPVRFGNNLTFLGYDRAPGTTYSPGDIFSSITYWRADGSLPDDMRIFTHILSDPAAIVAQTDTISVSPGELQDRDVFIQVMFVPLPPSLPDGMYNISTGAYRDTNDIRLAVLDGEQLRGTRLFLGQIPVEQN
jgi:hypothetical protein